MEQQPEKRQAERRPFPYPVQIEPGDPESGIFDPVRFEGQGVDISSGGVGITSESFFKAGQLIRLFIPLGTPETMIPAFSEVRWIIKSYAGYRIGLHFI